MPRPPTAVVDIDGVIATGTTEEVYSEEAGWAYEKCKPIPEGIRMLENFRTEGICIVLHTARWDSDDRVATENWLAKHEVPYDELIMDKPSGDIYIDDKGAHYQPGITDHKVLVERLYENRVKERRDE
jgi:uncharacterized HAD superfamily protein